MKTNYYQYTDKYLDLLEKFMFYSNAYKSNIDIPNKANIVIFDDGDKIFSTYSLKVLRNLRNKGEKNIVEVTRTGSKIVPWRISKAL